MKQVYLVCEAKVCAPDVQDPPRYVVLAMNRHVLHTVDSYQKHLVAMRVDGLYPNRVTEFMGVAAFKDPCDRKPLNARESKTLLFSSPEVKKQWLSEFEKSKSVSTLDDLADTHNRVDCCQLVVKEQGFLFTMYIKHTDTIVEINTLPNSVMGKIYKMLED
jgi:hypothetical protein